MRTAAMAVGLSCVLGIGGVAAVRSAETADVKLVGEVVDLHCYVTRGAAGAEHAGCANACIGRGVTPGFVAEDGRVFVLLGTRPFPVKDQVAGLAGSKVTVTGTPVERGGVRAFQLKTVERTEPGH